MNSKQWFSFRRDVAQPGRALAWGARGRQFKSARPDQFLTCENRINSTVTRGRVLNCRPRAPQGQCAEAKRMRTNRSRARGAGVRSFGSATLRSGFRLRSPARLSLAHARNSAQVQICPSRPILSPKRTKFRTGSHLLLPTHEAPGIKWSTTAYQLPGSTIQLKPNLR
jgi:hypothetical protein